MRKGVRCSRLYKKLIKNNVFLINTDNVTMNPTIEELYTIVNNLVGENTKIKEELRQLRQLITTQPKKPNQLLTNTPIPKMVFQEWVKTFKVTPKHLERVFIFDMMEGLKSCLQEYITTEGVHNIPIRTPPERRHVLYIYDQDVSCPNSTWSVCDMDDMLVLIDQLTLQFDIAFCEWDEKNRERMQSTQEDKDKYNVYLLKIEGKDFRKYKDKHRNELRNWLCEKVLVV
uniref:Uncharacterized protein n=1 Tax=viral metagenome TaxID=1070528 RepID=A0A6C0ID94_9ZZZZ